MSFTHQIGVSFKNDAGAITNTTDNYLVDAEINIDEVVPAGTANMAVHVAISVSRIHTLCIYADKNLTVKTNSANAPVDTLNLLEKKQVIWTVDHLEAKPLTEDVTMLYLTNGGVSDANLKLRCGLVTA
jgi:hypothetical protein